MVPIESRFGRLAVRILICAPVLSLLAMCLAWLVHGLDLPFGDDWRGYARGNIALLRLRYLLTPMNDTMSPVGLILEALAQRYLHGNSIAYQFLSMLLVLGALLLLQWRLLSTALGDRLLAAAAFSLTVLMIQPGSYWGQDNLAYHQALPLVTLLTALNLVLNGKCPLRRRLPVLLLLGSITGLSYVSGAFAVLLSALVLLAAAAGFDPERRRSVRFGALALLAAGLLTSAAQIWAVAFGQPGRLEMKQLLPLTWPDNPDFWFYAFGKIARSLLLPADHPLASALVVAVATALLALAAGHGLRRLRRDDAGSEGELRIAVVYLALLASVGAYLGMVSLGRAGLRPAEVAGAPAVFTFAFQRFHFFWVTLLWPWCLALLLALLLRRRPGPDGLRLARRVALAVALPALAAAILAGAFAHADYFRASGDARRQTLACLQSELAKGDGLRCPEFSGPNLHNLAGGYMYARELDASFVRYLPILPPPPPAPAPLLRWPDTGPGSVEMPPPGTPADKAGILLRTGRPEPMAQCLRLELTLRLNAGRADTAILDFGQPGKIERRQRSAPLVAADGGGYEAAFALESRDGFDDELRLYPGGESQSFALERLELRCRLKRG